MSGDDAVSAYIGMDATHQAEAAKIIALYMELGKEDTPLALEELNAKEISHMGGCPQDRGAARKDAHALDQPCRGADGGHRMGRRRAGKAPSFGGHRCGLRSWYFGTDGGWVCGDDEHVRLFGDVCRLHRLLFANDNWLLDPGRRISSFG